MTQVFLMLHPAARVLLCSTERLVLGWVVVEGGGGGRRPNDAHLGLGLEEGAAEADVSGSRVTSQSRAFLPLPSARSRPRPFSCR